MATTIDGATGINQVQDASITSQKLSNGAAVANVQSTPCSITLLADGEEGNGTLYASARGRSIQPTTSWQTFATLQSATQVGVRLKCISGHNSGVQVYYEANSDTYCYNIADGTVVNFATATGIGYVQLRKVKNNSYGGDGGWDYQIKKDQTYGVLAWLEVFGGEGKWRWTI